MQLNPKISETVFIRYSFETVDSRASSTLIPFFIQDPTFRVERISISLGFIGYFIYEKDIVEPQVLITIQSLDEYTESMIVAENEATLKFGLGLIHTIIASIDRTKEIAQKEFAKQENKDKSLVILSNRQDIEYLSSQLESLRPPKRKRGRKPSMTNSWAREYQTSHPTATVDEIVDEILIEYIRRVKKEEGKKLTPETARRKLRDTLRNRKEW